MRTVRLNRSALPALAGIALLAAPLLAASDQPSERGPVLRRPAASRSGIGPQSAKAQAAAYSTEIPLVTRIAPTADPNTLILNAAHPFSITLTARDTGRTGNSGPGLAIPQNDIFGFFSIPTVTGNSSNPEVFVKIIDGRGLNGAYWIFSNGLSDLEYTLTVREVATGRTKVYSKAFGSATACGTFDTSAFPSPAGDASPVDIEAIDAVNVANRASWSRTSLDLTNTTAVNGVTVELQYSYTCIASTCSPVNFFHRTPPQDPRLIFTLNARSSLHFDDIVGYMAGLAGTPLLSTGADRGSYGTLLVTFRNVPGTLGGEGIAYARTYSLVSEADPLKGAIGLSTPASFFYESSHVTLAGNARDTKSAPGQEGAVTSTVGIRNSDALFTQANATVDITFYDASNGARVGGTLTAASLQPGEVREFADVWTAAGIPASVHSVLVYADVRGGTLSSPTIDGYVTVDNVNSKDSFYFDLKCADAFCGQ